MNEFFRSGDEERKDELLQSFLRACMGKKRGRVKQRENRTQKGKKGGNVRFSLKQRKERGVVGSTFELPDVHGGKKGRGGGERQRIGGQKGERPGLGGFFGTFVSKKKDEPNPVSLILRRIMERREKTRRREKGISEKKGQENKRKGGNMNCWLWLSLGEGRREKKEWTQSKQIPGFPEGKKKL